MSLIGIVVAWSLCPNSRFCANDGVTAPRKHNAVITAAKHIDFGFLIGWITFKAEMVERLPLRTKPNKLGERN
jgi:hypothetical protein